MNIYERIEPTILMVQRHNKTGLLYFHKTSRLNKKNYLGSGPEWLEHLKEYGRDVETIWKSEVFEDTRIVEVATQFSKSHNIVESSFWANKCIENGIDGAPLGHENYFTQGHTEETKKKIAESKKGKKRPKWIIEAMQRGRNSVPRGVEENKKRSQSISNLRTYSDGQTTIRIPFNETPPPGFHRGMAKTVRRKYL